MDFDRISAISLQRATRWHPGGLSEWSPVDWSNAMYGEGGEKANVVKKVRRIDDSLVQAEGPKSYAEAYAKLATEIGYTYLYADLTLQRVGLRMADVVRDLRSAGTLNIHPQWSLVKLSNKAGARVGAICALTDELDDRENRYTEGRGTLASVCNELGVEVAKLVLLLERMAELIDTTLELCVVETFNRVSIREGFPERLELEAA